MVAAIPAYVGADFTHAPPGHRFRLYWEGWKPDFKTKLKQDMPELEAPEPEVCHALWLRAAEASDGRSVLRFAARLSSPLATGLGSPHPSDNGLTFLDPHGLPVLPGSSVKGSLRAAAEELSSRSHQPNGWTDEDVWALFGPDRTSAYVPDDRDREEHRRGALVFWDALPGTDVRCTYDIMNPHHGEYYSGKGPPSDDRPPVPIKFLMVPRGVGFLFHIEVTPAAESVSGGAERATRLVEGAFDLACRELGFGAKTSVGYGRFARDAPAEARIAKELGEARQKREVAEREQALASMSPFERMLADLETATKDKVGAIYTKLGSHDGDEKQRLALGIKKAYERLGEWHTKGSKKQIEKVKDLRRILGEGS